jgi:hypothetical protein
MGHPGLLQPGVGQALQVGRQLWPELLGVMVAGTALITLGLGQRVRAAVVGAQRSFVACCS